MSLDGYIAGPNGEADWIVMDPDFDFAELWAQFDTLLMGRRTYEAAIARLGKVASSMKGRKVVVASRTLHAAPGSSRRSPILADLNRGSIQTLRAQNPAKTSGSWAEASSSPNLCWPSTKSTPLR